MPQSRWQFYVCQKGTLLCLPALRLSRNNIYGAEEMKIIKIMKIFTGLKKIREFERRQLPFLRTVVDFDIVIEIGYAQELGQPLSLKQLFLLNLSSRTTVRRKLGRLIEREILVRRTHANDHRASVLTVAPSIVKVLGKYGGTLTSISVLHFT